MALRSDSGRPQEKARSAELEFRVIQKVRGPSKQNQNLSATFWRKWMDSTIVVNPGLAPSTEFSRSRLWTGRVIAGIITAFMLFDAIFKFINPAPVREAFARTGGRCISPRCWARSCCSAQFSLSFHAAQSLAPSCSPLIWEAQSRPTCGWKNRSSVTRFSLCISAY